MLVAPGAIAYLLTDRFERMLVIATAVAIGSSALGTIVSFHIDGATGACIVLIQTAVFVLAFLFAPKRGLVWGSRGSGRRKRSRSVLRAALPSPHFSHWMCLRRFKKPTGQEPRAARCGASGKRGDAPCRLLQPALRVAFRRASTASGVSTVWPDTVFAARRCICLAERATQAHRV